MSAADAIERLLGTTTDIDGDTLSINNLRLVEGEGTLTQNKDGSYTFTPAENYNGLIRACLLYTSPSPRDRQKARMPSSA